MGNWIAKLFVSPPPESAATKFINNIATDDLLLEIFLRLPDSKSAIQCSSISKRWHSIIDNNRFIRSFSAHHRRSNDQSDQDQAFLFQIRRSQVTDFLFVQHKIHPSNALPTNVVISGDKRDKHLSAKASFNDLALGFPWFTISATATRTTPDQDASDAGCLETREWSVSEVTSKRKLQFVNENIVNCGGVLYWLNEARWWAPEHGVVAFDPFGDTKQCHHIDVPAGLTGIRWLWMWHNLCLGACRGRLRLSWLEMETDWEKFFGVLELNEDENSWSLVRHKKGLEWLSKTSSLLGFHHNDGDFLFWLYEKHVVRRYNWLEDKLVDIGNFKDNVDILELMALQFVFPPWPTSLPAKYPSFSVEKFIEV
ncbi:hypothetical protein TIFTF001_022230 [Ficus carica]|uniref:F-box domain-containing protein n=1 Tax=Ficus carica TaxID=3494 RepID=A0AA88DED0_FICCA|nr:hypothetical protein TIFTF001_022230 [Ficus carica]